MRFTPIWELADADITTLQAGDFNSGAISEDGSVYVWGRCVDHHVGGQTPPVARDWVYIGVPGQLHGTDAHADDAACEA